jgi:hypothetical protein
MNGCEKYNFISMVIPPSDLVNSRFEQSMRITQGKAVTQIEAADDYMFYVCTDTHIDKTSVNLEAFNSILRNDDNATFGVMLGDAIDRRDNLPRYLEAIDYNPNIHKFDYTIFNVIGNHDVYFNGWEDYKSLIGPSVYWFKVKTPSYSDLYITLDSATGTLGRKQFDWLKSFLAENRNQYRHCIVFTHVNILYSDLSQWVTSNLPIDETFALLELFSKYNIELVLQGHDHYRDDQIFNGVRYTVVGTIEDSVDNPEYITVFVNNENIDLDWHSL